MGPKPPECGEVRNDFQYLFFSDIDVVIRVFYRDHDQ